jgi:hypothetical protein
MMCNGCKYADWKRTSKGRLHPDKTGRCTYLIHHPLNLKIPVAYYWGWNGETPRPSGGFIERDKDLNRDCSFRIALSATDGGRDG